MEFWYKFLTYLFYPFTPIYLFLRKLKKKEDAYRYKEKMSKIEKPRGNGFLVWIHIASVGEAMSILPLIDRFEKEQKIDKILITSITLSSGKILSKKFAQNSKVIHQFLPLDIPWFTKKFLNHWNPNLSIFIDSEIWPNLILQINKKKIPLLLVNARITKKSFNRWNLAISFAKKIFSKFDLCIVSNEESKNFLKVLGAKNIKSYGNLKFSDTNKDLSQKLDSSFLDKIKNRRVWCAASTHPSEEIFCAKSHLRIKKDYNSVLTIIIPRHIDRIKKINKELLNLNLKTVLSSNSDQIDSSTDILLVDSYGETLKFYDISKYVFLGKSLIKSLMHDSGQNPIEPAKLGCKILHGPNVSNFAETYSYFKKLGITKEVNNESELSTAIVENFKEDEDKNYEIVKKIEDYGLNILNNVSKEIKKYINT